MTSIQGNLLYLNVGLFEYLGFSLSIGDVHYLNIFEHKNLCNFPSKLCRQIIVGSFGFNCLYLILIFRRQCLHYIIILLLLQVSDITIALGRAEKSFTSKKISYFQH